MSSRYAPPRSAQESEEKKRREKGEGNTGTPPPPPTIERKPTVQMRKFKKDGYDYHEFNTPASPETFHTLTKGKYRNPVGT